ncbi:hypothetical protein POJ06DRAFT_261246 [Lipomyces tetrasporus]|uniref:Pentatricopeptide repeat-containing protein n=1 Tax=Lipomyces tetrasporus TaxID=54092 RepID=A0AAD7QLY2_9ASCO|nr:uncharacterized protein POJ06DRAFT_261246 [Lipomyces tetrasporus]KAJ8097395.1 hypothetical protein POJ06DRAFT_261246 [Lipomyces tetrasporus]
MLRRVFPGPAQLAGMPTRANWARLGGSPINCPVAKRIHCSNYARRCSSGLRCFDECGPRMLHRQQRQIPKKLGTLRFSSASTATERDQEQVDNVEDEDEGMPGQQTRSKYSPEVLALMEHIKGAGYYDLIQMYERMRPVSRDSWGEEPDVIGRVFMGRFMAVNLPVKAAAVWTDMQKAGMLENYSVETLNAHLLAASRVIVQSGDMVSRQRVLDALFNRYIVNGEINRDAFTILLDAYYRLGAWEVAEALMEDIKNEKVFVFRVSGELAKGPKTKKYLVRPRIGFYNIVFKYRLKAGKLKEALDLFHQVRVSRLRMDSIAYNMFISHFIRVENDLDKALEIIKLMERDKVKKDAATYSIILYATFHRLYLLRVPLDEHSQPKPAALTGQRGLDQPILDAGKEALRSVLKEMRDDDIPFTPHVLHTMTVGLIDITKDMHMADIFFLTGSKLVPVTRRTVTALLEGHLRQGSTSRALVLFNEIMPQLNIRGSVKNLNALLQRLIDDGDVDTAFSLFFKVYEESESKGIKSNFDLPSVRTASILLNVVDASSPYTSYVARLTKYMASHNLVPTEIGTLNKLRRLNNVGVRIDPDLVKKSGLKSI